MTLGNAGRKFWEQVYCRLIKQALLDSHALRTPQTGLEIAALCADGALKEWERRWVREEPADVVRCEGCPATLDLSADYGKAGHGWAFSDEDGCWTCPACAKALREEDPR